MEPEATPLIGKSSDSSLTESWNVVDPHEVNNASEGSDGESIEVIEEEAQNTESNTDKGPDSKDETSNISPNNSPNVEDASIANDPSSEGHPELGEHEDIEVLGSTLDILRDHGGSWGRNIFIASLFIALIGSVLLSCAVFSIFLLKVEEFALDQFKYFTSPYPSESSGNDFQELLDKIKIYQEESSYLKGIVADLNTAVLTLKDELASRGDISKSPIIPPVLSAEDQLFNELLNIHTGNFQSGTESEYVPEAYEHSFNVIENMLRRLTLDEEREKNMEAIKLFYLIPKHLTVLSAHYPTNQDIKFFIDTWKDKLSSVNEHLIADMKEMQIKMIRHTVKHLKQTERCFFKKLCDLKNFKKSECYETFIKPYDKDETLDMDSTICSVGRKQDVKSDILGNQSCSSKSKDKSTKFNEGETNNCKSSVENKYTNNVKESEKVNDKPVFSGKRKLNVGVRKNKLKEPCKPKSDPPRGKPVAGKAGKAVGGGEVGVRARKGGGSSDTGATGHDSGGLRRPATGSSTGPGGGGD